MTATTVPSNLKYTKEHEWVKLEGDTAIVGITDYAQQKLGDIVFVELPSTGEDVNQNSSFSVVESVKAASDIYAPLSGLIDAINQELEDNPALINTSPYEQGWIAKLTNIDASQLDSLLSAEQYQQLLQSEE